MNYWHVGALLIGVVLIGVTVLHLENPLKEISESSFNSVADLVVQLVILGAILILVYLILLAYIGASRAFGLPTLPQGIEERIVKEDSDAIVKEVMKHLTKALYYALLAFVSVMVGAIGGEMIGYQEIQYQLVLGIFLVIDSGYSLVVGKKPQESS